MMVLFRFLILSFFCLFFCLFSCGKQSRYSLLISLCSVVPIISTLLFNSSFSNAIRSKIITKQTFSFALQTVFVILLLNNNDGRNYCSTILHVKVRTKYAEVNILKKEVAIKLNIQLASSINLIWRSVVSLAFLVRLVDLYLAINFPPYFIILFLNL